MTCCAGLPCATMSGIGGWSPGYQSAGPAPSRICAAVNDELLPGSLCIVGSGAGGVAGADRKSTRLNSSHGYISYAVFCLKKKKPPAYRRQAIQRTVQQLRHAV